MHKTFTALLRVDTVDGKTRVFVESDSGERPQPEGTLENWFKAGWRVSTMTAIEGFLYVTVEKPRS